MTGVLASFGAYEKWADELSNKVLANGIVLGDGKMHKVTIMATDTQSDAQRASQVAGDMITNDKVDFIISSGTPDSVNPSADQCEALGCPMVSTNDPMEAFIFGRGLKADTVQKYPYGLLFGVDEELITQPQAFDKVPNNKKMGILLANEVDGNVWASVIVEGFKKLGYDVTFPQQYQPGTEDFTTQISAFKKAGCDILTGTHYANDFSNFWKQTQQQGFKPKLVFIGGKTFSDFSFPKANGPTSVGLMANWLLHKTFPFKDPLTGMTVAQLCDKFEADTGNEWSENCGVQTARSWAVDCLKRAKSPDDKDSIVEAIKTTKLETPYGPIDFTEPVSATGRHPFANVYKAVTTTIQCVNGADAKPTANSKFPYDCNVVGANYLEGLPTYQTIEQHYE
jgi:branched-chain amino acid transport system substrate-binding protein